MQFDIKRWGPFLPTSFLSVAENREVNCPFNKQNMVKLHKYSCLFAVSLCRFIFLEYNRVSNTEHLINESQAKVTFRWVTWICDWGGRNICQMNKTTGNTVSYNRIKSWKSRFCSNRLNYTGVGTSSDVLPIFETAKDLQLLFNNLHLTGLPLCRENAISCVRSIIKACMSWLLW